MADSVLLCALITEGDILQRHAVTLRLQSCLYGRKGSRLRQSLQAADRLSAEEEVLRQIGAAHNTESDDRCDQDVEKHIRDHHHRISSVTNEDDCHRDEDESEGTRQHRVEGHRAATDARILRHEVPVVDDASVEALEGVDRLLEDLDYRDPPDILNCLGAHTLLGIKVLPLKTSPLSTHHVSHQAIGKKYRDKGSKPQLPVHHEEEYKDPQWGDNAARDIRQEVCHKRVRHARVLIDDLPHPTGILTVKESKWRTQKAIHGKSTHIRLHPKRSQVREH